MVGVIVLLVQAVSMLKYMQITCFHISNCYNILLNILYLINIEIYYIAHVCSTLQPI